MNTTFHRKFKPKAERSVAQRKLYLDMAGKAYARCIDPDDNCALPLEAWRRDECRYATGGKSFSDGLTNDELTRALRNFGSRADTGERATEDEMRRAVARNHINALRALWESIEPGARIKVMRERFKIVVLEEAENFGSDELKELRLTLLRLAADYPRRK
jgi:hypothetical protein